MQSIKNIMFIGLYECEMNIVHIGKWKRGNWITRELELEQVVGIDLILCWYYL